MRGTRSLTFVPSSRAGPTIVGACDKMASADDLKTQYGGVYMWREAIQRVLISEAELDCRIQALGRVIATDYQGTELVFVAVLKGALMFSADLARAVDLPLTIDYIALSSYGNRQVSSGRVTILKDLSESIADKHVLIVEDIVDTGISLHYLWNHLMSHHPADLNICTLLDKRARRQVELPIKYTGFDVPDAFVVGYGLDYQQRYRNLPFIGILHPEVFAQEPR
jgi:hypoxanthine phosphoribosyltransferase